MVIAASRMDCRFRNGNPIIAGHNDTFYSIKSRCPALKLQEWIIITDKHPVTGMKTQIFWEFYIQVARNYSTLSSRNQLVVSSFWGSKPGGSSCRVGLINKFFSLAKRKAIWQTVSCLSKEGQPAAQSNSMESKVVDSPEQREREKVSHVVSKD